jgi:molecular chaperone GrpE
MSRDEQRPKGPPPPSDDDIEILEVVGVDEDGAFPSAVEPAVAEDDAVEIVFDDEAAAPPVPAPPPDGIERRVDLATRERFLRLQADLENFKKRMERERADHLRHATGALVARLLPVLDNFERAIVAARGGGDPEALRAGIEMVYRQFLEELRREGLRDIEALGLPFDPEVHEAVATQSGSPLPVNTVVEEMQRGFYFQDRVLRPALVRVSVEGEPDGTSREDG